MAIENYPLGQVVRIDFTCKDAAGALQDPNVLKLTVDAPNAASVTYTYGLPDNFIIRDSLGTYHALVLSDHAGDWIVTVESDDSNPELRVIKTKKWATTSRPVSL